MGEVYRARDTMLGREVAIKVLPQLVSSDPDRLLRFEQEARSAAALNHPNILAVYQMGNYFGVPYMVSELLDGMTLTETIRRSQLPFRKAIDYGVQIARGLGAAHEKGIVHRDLKPDNIIKIPVCRNLDETGLAAAHKRLHPLRSRFGVVNFGPPVADTDVVRMEIIVHQTMIVGEAVFE